MRGGRGGVATFNSRGGRGNMRGGIGPSPWAKQGPQNWGNPWNQGMGGGMAMQNPLMGGGMGQMSGMGGGMMGMGMGMGGGGWGNSGMGQMGGMNQMGGKKLFSLCFCVPHMHFARRLV